MRRKNRHDLISAEENALISYADDMCDANSISELFDLNMVAISHLSKLLQLNYDRIKESEDI